mmetsp:Transcript_90741/g.180449  ORF Transcript_90741/g.180449 Transcript_90741/m.180449 type:complete len:114 (+) Transcript_90741:907-1248(+)
MSVQAGTKGLASAQTRVLGSIATDSVVGAMAVPLGTNGFAREETRVLGRAAGNKHVLPGVDASSGRWDNPRSMITAPSLTSESKSDELGGHVVVLGQLLTGDISLYAWAVVSK